MLKFQIRLLAIILGLVLASALANTSLVSAQENSVTIKFSLFSVEGLVIGDTYTFDAEFAERLNVEVPAPFSFLTPRADGVKVIFQRPQEGTTELIKINFVTEDEQLIENLRFVKITLPMAPPADRLQILGRFLSTDAYNMSTAGYEQKQFLGAREITIDGNAGIEAFGKYIDPDLGLMYVRLVGIINPDGVDCILAAAAIVADRVQLENIDDLARSFTGTTVRYFAFLDQ